MRTVRVDGYLGRSIDVDVCIPCQSLWFDAYEHLQLTPGATLAVFRIIGEHVARPDWQPRDVAHCPRCRAQLRKTQDLQRATRFEYYRCPNRHGRLTSFFDFLKEKDFIKPMPAAQVAELRKYVQSVNCSNCGAAVDLMANAHCTHCGTPVSILDLEQAERLIGQLKAAETASHQPVEGRLGPALARARQQTDDVFRSIGVFHHESDHRDVVGAGLRALWRLMQND